MTLAELLSRTPVSTETNLYDFLSSNLLHEVNGMSFAWGVESPRVRVDILFFHDFDCNRIWELAVVRLDGEPVMLTQRAGRSGQDHQERYVVSKERLVALIQHVITLGDCFKDVVEVDVNEERGDLATFYNHTLEGEFENWSSG